MFGDPEAGDAFLEGGLGADNERASWGVLGTERISVVLILFLAI